MCQLSEEDFTLYIFVCRGLTIFFQALSNIILNRNFTREVFAVANEFVLVIKCSPQRLRFSSNPAVCSVAVGSPSAQQRHTVRALDADRTGLIWRCEIRKRFFLPKNCQLSFRSSPVLFKTDCGFYCFRILNFLKSRGNLEKSLRFLIPEDKWRGQVSKN